MQSYPGNDFGSCGAVGCHWRTWLGSLRFQKTRDPEHILHHKNLHPETAISETQTILSTGPWPVHTWDQIHWLRSHLHARHIFQPALQTHPSRCTNMGQNGLPQILHSATFAAMLKDCHANHKRDLSPLPRRPKVRQECRL